MDHPGANKSRSDSDVSLRLDDIECRLDALEGRPDKLRRRRTSQMSRDACIFVVDQLLQTAAPNLKVKTQRAAVIAAITGLADSSIINGFSRIDRELAHIEEAIFSGETFNPSADIFARKTSAEIIDCFMRMGRRDLAAKLRKSIEG